MYVTDKRHSLNRKTLGDESIVSSLNHDFDDLTILRHPTMNIKEHTCQDHSPRSTLMLA